MRNLPQTELQNIVLDLGGVLYAIDVALTGHALQRLAGPKAKPLTVENELFHAFERGEMDNATFRNALREALDANCTDADLDQAWNALLLGPIPGRIEWVRKLSERYRVILLSNTNVIHAEVWGPECTEMFQAMEKTWFSFDLGLRKPDLEIYRSVLSAMGMEPSKSLFLDDSEANLQGAEAIGMPGILIDPRSNSQFEEICLELLGKV